MYINRKQFGHFVAKLLETKRKEEVDKLEKDNDWKLWVMYTRLCPDKSFPDWKAEVMTQPAQKYSGSDTDLDDEGIMNILDGLFTE